jgi:hypothetical protein
MVGAAFASTGRGEYTARDVVAGMAVLATTTAHETTNDLRSIMS